MVKLARIKQGKKSMTLKDQEAESSGIAPTKKRTMNGNT